MISGDRSGQSLFFAGCQFGHILPGKIFFRGMVVGHEKVDWPDAGTFVYDSLCNKVFRYMAGW